MSSVIFATGSYDRTVKFWEATTGLCYHSIALPNNQYINRITSSHSKELLAVAVNQQIRIYHIGTNQSSVAGSLDGHQMNIVSMGFSKNDNWMYSGSEDKTIRLWDLRGFKPSSVFSTKSPINSVDLHNNQAEIASGDENGFIKLWDLTKDGKTPIFKDCPKKKVAIRSVSVSSDGKRLIAANNDGDVFVYELKPNDPSSKSQHSSSSLKLIKTFKAHNDYILKCLISPNAKQLATASADHTVKLWDIRQDDIRLDKTLDKHTKWVWDISYSSDSAYLISSSSDTTSKLWELTNGDVIMEYKGHKKAVITNHLNDKFTS